MVVMVMNNVVVMLLDHGLGLGQRRGSSGNGESGQGGSENGELLHDGDFQLRWIKTVIIV